MVSLYKDPHGEKIFSNISPRENMKTSAGRSTSGTDDNTELGALAPLNTDLLHTHQEFNILLVVHILQDFFTEIYTHASTIDAVYICC